MSHNALLEIGTEEIPAKLAPEIHDNLLATAREIIKENRIPVREIKVMGAPRRLVLIFSEIGAQQKKEVEEIKGPPENIAYNDNGEPTAALKGFMSNKGLSSQQLEIRDTDRGRYLYAVIEREKKSVFELLPEVFSDIIKGLNFSQSMHWGTGDFEFVRPIHWICALFDDRVLNFRIANIDSDGKTRGHRFLAPEPLTVASVDQYVDLLRKNFVLVDPRERKEKIKEGISRLEEKFQVSADLKSDLLKEVIHLVEYPTPFYGKFSRRYLELPEPVLVTPTREHQRYFPVRDNQGVLAPGFMGVRDGSEQSLDTVVEGNEKVLKARFDDAEFYYEQDLEVSNETRIEKLKGLLFREELGSMYDKISRLEKIASFVAQKLQFSSPQIDNISRAAYLSKSDLVSDMVREFPELQGTMGGIYARQEGAAAEIYKAVTDHYHPEHAGDRLPETEEGKILALADKLDNLCGCFAAGLQPTGSEDPYGLRRAALGIIRLLEDLKLNTRPEKLISIVLDSYEQEEITVQGKVLQEITNFLQDRLRYKLESEAGFDYDVISAGLQGQKTGIPGQIARITALDRFRSEGKFRELITVYNRIDNIVRGTAEKKQIKSDLLLEKEEQNLYNIYWQTLEKVDNWKEADYNKVYRLLCELIDPVHNFFESVKVMSDKEEIRKNRLRLLSAILEKMSYLGHLSEIVTE